MKKGVSWHTLLFYKSEGVTVMSKRIMLKLSGEALGNGGWLFDHEMVNKVAGVLCKVASEGFELAVVIGGGNIWRGRKGAASGMDAVTADQMGMLATVLNCLCMKDAVIRQGAKARVMSAIDMPRVCDTFRADKARKALSKGAIVFFAGGLGSPFFTTDTAVVLRSVEIQADVLLLAKSIDGVYTADPNVDPSAVLIKDITYQEAIRKGLKVMDMSAFAMCADQKLPGVRVFALSDPENILKVLRGDSMGTVLHP